MFYILGCWYCVEIKLVYLFYLFLCYFVLDSNVRICIILKLLNVLISLTEFILDIIGEFKVMHFTLSNLLHDFLNDKYMSFSLYIYIYIYINIHVKNTGQSDPTSNSIDPNPFLTRLKWLVFDLQPIWPATQLTQSEPNPTRPFCHV